MHASSTHRGIMGRIKTKVAFFKYRPSLVGVGATWNGKLVTIHNLIQYPDNGADHGQVCVRSTGSSFAHIVCIHNLRPVHVSVLTTECRDRSVLPTPCHLPASVVLTNIIDDDHSLSGDYQSSIESSPSSSEDLRQTHVRPSSPPPPPSFIPSYDSSSDDDDSLSPSSDMDYGEARMGYYDLDEGVDALTSSVRQLSDRVRAMRRAKKDAATAAATSSLLIHPPTTLPK